MALFALFIRFISSEMDEFAARGVRLIVGQTLSLR
jgi:hypothetical protein